MLNRRSFFKSLGTAILGTVLYLKIPDSLIPLLPEIQKPQITYRALYEAYVNRCRGNIEPCLMVLNPKTYGQALDMLTPVGAKHLDGGFKFMGAKVIPNGLFEQSENEIRVYGGYDWSVDSFYFV